MYQASETRYDKMIYNRCGKSGLLLSAMSLGMWHNFGSSAEYANMADMVTTAFDLGITHFDLANNYGPAPGAAEENIGRILHNELSAYRDELIISTKAGYTMWPGPYGDHGSRKYMIASLDQSLHRMGLEYVDIFYHHRPDPDTPMEETAAALDYIVRSGKALYVGVSNYTPEQTQKMASLMRSMGTPLTVHQPRYNMLDREFYEELEPILEQEGIGSVSAWEDLPPLTSQTCPNCMEPPYDKMKLVKIRELFIRNGERLLKLEEIFFYVLYDYVNELIRDKKITVYCNGYLGFILGIVFNGRYYGFFDGTELANDSHFVRCIDGIPVDPEVFHWTGRLRPDTVTNLIECKPYLDDLRNKVLKAKTILDEYSPELIANVNAERFQKVYKGLCVSKHKKIDELVQKALDKKCEN